MSRRHAAGLVLAVALAATPASGATIQLSVTATAVATPDGIDVALVLQNSGDAPAISVTPIVVFRGLESLGAFVPSLAPSARHTDTIRLALPEGAPPRGRWPFFVRIAYGDGQHPFEALHVGTVTFGPSASAAAVGVELRGTDLDTVGELGATLRGPAGTSVSLTFLVPAGLAVVPENATIALTARARPVVGLVTRAGATPDSRLPVFAVAEYEAGGVHDTAVASAIVRVAPEDGEAGWRLGAGLLGLALAFGALLLWRRRPRS